MGRPHIDNYSSASTTLQRPLIVNTNKMSNKNGGKKSVKEFSTSTHSSRSRSDHKDAHRSKVATSMRKFLEEDDDFDYLGNLTQGKSKTSSRDIPRNSNSSSSRRRTPTSYRKNSTGRPNVPRARSNTDSKLYQNHPRSSKPKSIRKSSTSDVFEASLNDEKPKESTKSLMQSARRLLDKAARAASPGRLRGGRSKSPGKHKNRNSFRGTRSTSPTSSRTDQLTASPTSPSTKKKQRAKSPGRLKKREGDGENPGDVPRSTRTKKRSESSGRMKSRSKSPGKMKKRSQSPGALRKVRPSRRPDNGGENDDSKRRSRSSGALKKPERARSHDRNKPRSRRDGAPRPPLRSTQSTDELEEDAPKEESYSNMQHELNRYKVKRNKSMDAAMAHAARKTAKEVEDDDARNPPRRAESMLLSREMGRRGKQNSLMDLVQYKEEEIHSTSYFASNHVLINRERMKRGLRPLTRNIAMDDLARKSAETMATSTGISTQPTTYVGNVLRGETIRTIHRSTMLQKQGRERANILNPYFQDFGVGTCKGTDGMLYMCQLFSERLELALTDTAQDD